MNRYTTPVMFAFEKDVTFVSARIVFGANGVAVVDAINSKGVAAFNPETVVFGGNTVGSSATVSSITSFTGLFNGMTVSGASIPASITISSMTAGASSLVLSTGTGVSTAPGETLFASGGRYRMQFGLSVGNRFDTYNKIMGFCCDFREVTASASGTSTALQLSPQCSDWFIVQNNIGIRTIPATLTSGSTDASIAIQFGQITGNQTFTAYNPQAGETLHIYLAFGNSTAI